MMLLQLALEALEKRKRVGRRSREACQNLVIEHTARFPRGLLHNVLAHSDLAIRHHHDFIVLANAQNRRAVHPFASLLDWHPIIIQRELFRAPGPSLFLANLRGGGIERSASEIIRRETLVVVAAS